MVKSFSRTVAILEALQSTGGATVSELAETVNVPKSTIYNHLQTLEQHGYLVKQGADYSLGLRFLELGETSRNQKKLYRVANREISNLASETNELTKLSVEEFGEVVYLCVEQSQQEVNLNPHPGKRVNMHCSAVGKAILAYMPEERREEILRTHGLPKKTEHTITNKDELIDELAEIDERGYAFDDEEFHNGLRCVAAPIRNDDGQVLGAVSISGPTSRMKGDRFNEELPEMLLDTVNIIELNLSFSFPP